MHENLFWGEEGRSGLWNERSAGAGGSGSSSVLGTSLREFWEGVRGKFGGVREVWIVPGREERFFPGLRGRHGREGESGDGDVDADVLGLDRCRDKEGKPDAFYWRVLRAVSYVEERWGWTAPEWRVMALPEVEREERIDERIDADMDVDMDMRMGMDMDICLVQRPKFMFHDAYQDVLRENCERALL